MSYRVFTFWLVLRLLEDIEHWLKGECFAEFDVCNSSHLKFMLTFFNFELFWKTRTCQFYFFQYLMQPILNFYIVDTIFRHIFGKEKIPNLYFFTKLLMQSTVFFLVGHGGFLITTQQNLLVKILSKQIILIPSKFGIFVCYFQHFSKIVLWH